MRIIVTGGAGFIGSHLCDYLLAQGQEVICMDNLFTSHKKNIAHLMDKPRFEFVRHDVCDPWHIECDRIYHLACPASPVHYQRNPVRTIKTAMVGTLNALECARNTGARLLITSTSEVYGDPTVHPQPESYWGNVNPVGPRACYDEGKRVGESLASSWSRQYKTDVRIARLFNTYGPRMAFNDGRLIPNFILQAMKREPLTIYGTGKQTRSFCYVTDTVQGLVKLMELDDFSLTFYTEERPIIVNIGNPDERTILSVANDVNRAFDYFREDVTRPVTVDLTSKIQYMDLPVDDPKQRCPDISRAKELLGWEPKVSYSDGIELTINWFRNQPPEARNV